METSTELPLARETSMPMVERSHAGSVEAEFWPNESLKYESVMQPASRRTSVRGVSLVLAVIALLIAVSFCVVVYELPHSFLSLWSVPSSSSR